jgi:hypothetical protein
VEQLIGRLGRLPIAGICVTLMALLAMWRQNLNRLPIESVWPTVAGAVAIAVIIVVIFRMFGSSWARAGLLGGLVAVYVFYAPAFVRLLPLPYLAAAIAHLGIIAMVILAGLRIPSDPDRARSISGRVNFLCLLILAITLGPIAGMSWTAERVRGKAAGALGDFEGQAGANSPDVWHILFDRYAGIDTLRSTYRYDNRPFVAALRQRGFAVSDEAYSNYQRTAHSVASTMNGSMLDPLAERMREQPNDWVPIYREMRNGAALRFFNRQDYRTVFAGSWWEPTRFSNGADESLSIRAVPQLARLAIDTSAIGFWTRKLDVPYLDGRGDQCFRANEKFRRLRELAASDERKYVFAHFLVPHPPFVLNADGSCRSLAVAKAAGRQANYVAQVEFANREVLALIDAILAGPRPARIVIHGDEGPWPAPYVGNEHGLGTDPVAVPWSKLPPEKLKEKMSTLLAVRGPAGPPATMPGSPVQIYPAILRDHFGSKKPLPASRYLIFEDDQQLYRFRDVSKQLGQN